MQINVGDIVMCAVRYTPLYWISCERMINNQPSYNQNGFANWQSKSIMLFTSLQKALIDNNSSLQIKTLEGNLQIVFMTDIIDVISSFSSEGEASLF